MALCPVDKCNFSCNDFGIMEVHQYDDHGFGVEARCKDCNKKFGNFRVYERHIQACNLPKDKECPVCKKAYKSAERLSTHMDVAHKGSPKMICDKCGKIFTSKDSLRVHKANLHERKGSYVHCTCHCTNNHNTIYGYCCNAHKCYARSVHGFHMLHFVRCIFFHNLHLFQGKATDLK